MDSSLALSLRTVHRVVGGHILGAGAGSRGQDFLKVAFGLRSTNLCLSGFTGKKALSSGLEKIRAAILQKSLRVALIQQPNNFNGSKLFNP